MYFFIKVHQVQKTVVLQISPSGASRDFLRFISPHLVQMSVHVKTLGYNI